MNNVQSEPLLDANETAPSSKTTCAVAPDRGDVTTVQAANYVKLEETKRVENHSHAPSHHSTGVSVVGAEDQASLMGKGK